MLKNGAQEESAQLAAGVEPHFARGGKNGMPMEDDDFLLGRARKFF